MFKRAAAATALLVTIGGASAFSAPLPLARLTSRIAKTTAGTIFRSPFTRTVCLFGLGGDSSKASSEKVRDPLAERASFR